MRNILINSFLVFISVLLTLLAAEYICRLIYDPIDILSPRLAEDNILGHYIEPYSGGHDAWGFRNFDVPDSVDVAVIGDSQTWGINARARESFPFRLGSLVNKSVYNFGVSGYGPVQYAWILEERALKLNPSQIVIAFYLGNDFDDAYRLAYQNDHWKNLRKAEYSYDESYPETIRKNLGLMYGFRFWINHNSVLYRLFKSRMDFILQYVKDADSNFVRYTNEPAHIDKYFNPYSRLSVIDHRRPHIQGGFRISLECLSRIKNNCKQYEKRLLVAIIPTDIMVYSDYLMDNNSIGANNEFKLIIESERKLKEDLITWMTKENIAYVDVTDSLKAHASENIYPKYEDGHPSAWGYEQIAKAIAVRLRD